MSDSPERKKRKRLTPPSDNVSITLRLPRKMVETLEGMSAATGLTVQSLAVAAVDAYLHARGAYRPYAPGEPSVPSSPQLSLPLPLPAVMNGVPHPGLAELPELPEAEEIEGVG